MFDNIGYQFSNLEELLMFVEWLTATFDKPEDFEKYLLEKMPHLEDADDAVYAVTSIDAISLMDDDEQFLPELCATDTEFWEMINHEYPDEETNDKTISGSD